MLCIDESTLDGLTMKFFFRRIHSFIEEHCLNEDMRDWANAQAPDYDAWSGAWRVCRDLDEQSAALILTTVAFQESDPNARGSEIHPDILAQSDPAGLKLLLVGNHAFAESVFR